jgi:hypothetical protein
MLLSLGSFYASSPPPASRSFGHCSKCLCRLLVGNTRERHEARRSQPNFFDRRVRILLEEAQEPARGDPLVPARILPGDEHGQFECVDEVELWEVFRSGQRRQNVPALECSLKDRVGVALRARGSSSLGAEDGSASLDRVALEGRQFTGHRGTCSPCSYRRPPCSSPPTNRGIPDRACTPCPGHGR